MTHVRKHKKGSKRKRRGDPPPNPVFMRRAMEKHFTDIERLVEDKRFGSIEDMNAYVQQFMGPGRSIPPPERELTPVERAQDVMFTAWEEPYRRKRIALARRALKISKDCADAHVLLAEESARDLEEAKEIYAKGVVAGKRVLGEELFAEVEAEGRFWSKSGTRPYMRARLGLAVTLWELGEREAALDHYRALLELNPDDNQGVRHLLLGALLEAGSDDEAGELLDRHDEGSAFWLYGRALWTFRREGAGRRANARLKEALRANPFVPLYLLGLRPIPGTLPDSIGIGDESEAVSYVADAHGGWVETEGSLEWFAKRLSGSLDTWKRDVMRTLRPGDMLPRDG